MACELHTAPWNFIRLFIFPAQWFYGLLRALPGDQACLTPSPALLIADLTPALGRQNDTTWPYAAVRSSSALTASTASRPAFVTIAKRPSEGRDRIAIVLILPRRQAKFLKIRNWWAFHRLGEARRELFLRSGPDKVEPRGRSDLLGRAIRLGLFAEAEGERAKAVVVSEFVISAAFATWPPTGTSSTIRRQRPRPTHTSTLPGNQTNEN